MLLAGKYRLEQPLGHGGMGTVYRAVDISLERRVAVKVMHASLAQFPELVERFEREARLMARLDHPNLVPIYAVEKNEDAPYIVMKLLDGVTLWHLGKTRGRPLRPREVTPLLQQLCAGLGFMHSRGVVHRDLKPGNLFVAPDGHLTILDFGVARDVDTGLTRPGEWLGTPLYMSPEQTMGSTLEPRSDLYSLGVILYELLTGKPPFIGENELETMRAHREGAIPDVASSSGTSRAISEVLAKLMAKAPAQRFASAEEVLEAWNAAVRAPAAAGEVSDETPIENAAAASRSTPAPSSPSSPSELGNATTRLRSAALTPTRLAETRLERSGPRPDPEPSSLAPLLDGDLGRTLAPAVELEKIEPREVEPAPTLPKAQAPVHQSPPSAGRWAAVLGLVVAALAIGALATLYFMQPPPASPPSVARDAPSPEPSAPEPPKPSAPAVAAPGPTQEERDEKVEPSPSRPPRPRSGELRVVVVSGDKSTWGDVKVDGVARGYAPATLQLAAGMHDVTVTRSGVVLTKKAKVTAGGTTVLKFEVRE